MKRILIIALFLCSILRGYGQLSPSFSKAVTGTITTANANQTTTATANSAVVIDCDANSQSISVQITGSYTSGAAATQQGFIAQATIDGVNWVTIPRLVRIVRNEIISNIPSAETGLFVIKNNSYQQVRVSSTNFAVTGTATITLKNSVSAYPTDAKPASYISTNDQPGTVGNGNLHFAIVGNNRTTVTIKKITWSDYNASGNNVQRIVQYIKGSAFIGGTSGAITTSRNKPNQLIEQSVALGYSANPTITGQVNIGQFNTGAGITSTTGIGYQTTIELDYQLIGAAQIFAIQNRTSVASSVAVCTVEWTEE